MSAGVVPFRADRFGSAVEHYRRYRLRYPERLIAEIGRHADLRPGGRVLDLGCGPGFLAVLLARAGHAVVAMDPDPAMLAMAAAEATEAGVTLDLRQGSSYDLSPALGMFDLVVMGRAFHWMDRPATLAALEAILAPRGLLALVADEHEKTAENAWVDVMRATAQEFAGPGGFPHRHPGTDWTGHVAILLDSAFPDVDQVGVWARGRLDTDAIVGRALSFSGSTPEALGDRQPAFEAALRERLETLGQGDAFTEVVQYTAILARRPA